MTIKSICLVGLGLMGGAFAKHIHQNFPDTHVMGVDPSQEAVDFALSKQWLSEGFSRLEEVSIAPDLVLVCSPDNTLSETFKSVKSCFGDVPLLEIASVKAPILEYLQSDEWASLFSIHPMIGSEKTGIQHSEELDFKGVNCLVCSENIPDSLSELLSGLGFSLALIDLGAHDRLLAYSSHFPYLMSLLTAKQLDRLGLDDATREAITGAGFRDTTRISSSSVEWGTAVLSQNKETVKELIQALRQDLDAVEKALDRPDDLRLFLS